MLRESQILRESDRCCYELGMRARLMRHVSSSGRTRVRATSLSEDVASVAELADLYHGRWRIEETFKRLKHRLGLECVSGLSQHALLVDVAAKVLADNLAALLNRAVPMVQASPAGVRRHSAILEQFDEDAAHADHDGRTEQRVARQAQERLRNLQARKSPC